jgi:hypothetical protein
LIEEGLELNGGISGKLKVWRKLSEKLVENR